MITPSAILLTPEIGNQIHRANVPSPSKNQAIHSNRHGQAYGDFFPKSWSGVYEWVKVKRERFGGYSALDVMLEDGKEGIHAIRCYLDHERTR